MSVVGMCTKYDNTVPFDPDITPEAFAAKHLETVFGTKRAIAKYATTVEDREAASLEDWEIELASSTQLPEEVDLWSVRLGQQVAIRTRKDDKDSFRLVQVLDRSLHRWMNDCDHCVFLGRDDSGTDTDMWLCPPKGATIGKRIYDGSVIARTGENSEYASSPICMVGRVIDQYNRAGPKSLVDHQDAFLHCIARAMRLGIVGPFNLIDGLTKASPTDIRRFFEKRRDDGEFSMAGELPDFLCDF